MHRTAHWVKAARDNVVRVGLVSAGLVSIALACSDDPSAGSSGTGGSSTGGSHAANTGGGAAGTGGSTTGGSGATAGSAATSGGGGQAGTGAVGGTGGAPANVPSIAGCPVFTPEDDWNLDISHAPVSDVWTQRLLDEVGDIRLHPDFGNWETEQYGIPINVVPADQPMVPVVFDWWEEESDPGPYPFPDPGEVLIEGGNPTDCAGDCHVLVVRQQECKLYEGFGCRYDNQWHCGNGAVWDLTGLSYGQRPSGWTSADAAGLPIAPGLIRYDEVHAGEIKHAIRFTLACTRSNYVKPATHHAGNCGDAEHHPPMGMRVRLRADFDIAGFGPTARVILKAMKTYGMILADNGSDFYFQGEVHPGWDDDVNELEQVPVSAFEVLEPPPFGP
ncbi:MAG: hypothetical protein ACOC1F_02135 [Myxococcota bacterium]